MGIRYEYKCSTCGHDYIEQRNEGETAFFTECNKGDGGSYELVKETPVEVTPVEPVIIDNPTQAIDAPTTK